MGAALEMLADAVRCYEEMDSELAHAVIRRDQELDEMTWGTIRERAPVVDRRGDREV